MLTTDKNGFGYIFRELTYCPVESCAGKARCTLYINLSYHFDHMVYGGAPALEFGGQGAGLVVSNQLHFFTNGEVLFPPQNNFNK